MARTKTQFFDVDKEMQWYKMDKAYRYPKKQESRNVKKIDMFSIEGNYLRTFNSLEEAAKYAHCSQANIRQQIKVKKPAMGYRFAYAEESNVCQEK